MLLNTSNKGVENRVSSPLKFQQTRNKQEFVRELAFKSTSVIETAEKHYDTEITDIETS
jgi:hypothetical protein